MARSRTGDRLTAYQWRVLFVAWLGWVFDAMDSTIYAFVLKPALSELLGGRAGVADIGLYGGIIFSIFLIGWALGGVVFGIVADRIGRTKTLVFTILIYSIFTGMAALSQDWWHLAIYRFITALGIGGEWAAGAALVAETWPESRRTQGAGFLQSAWAGGFFIAAVATRLIGADRWRLMFLIGILPAVVAMIVRLFVREPERWVKAKEKRHAVLREGGIPDPGMLRQILRPPYRRDTVAGSVLAFVAVFGLWGGTNWIPTLVSELLTQEGVTGKTVSDYVSYAGMALNGGAIIGYLAFGPIADRIGRKPTFGLMCLGSFIMLPVTFLVPHSYAVVLMLVPVLGFFNNGIFSGFPIYLPELYPTALRGTGAGFCFNVGRVLAAIGPFVTGSLVALFGSYGKAVSIIALIYLLGIAILPLARETKGMPLPE